MNPIQEEDPKSILPASECVRMFFIGIALIAGSTAITWGIWHWNDQTLTFVLWPFGLVGLFVAGLGIVFGLLHARSWSHRIMLLLLYAVVTSVVFTVCLDFYLNDLGYPRNSGFLNLIADVFR